jgi:hypothetical protein
MEDVVSLSLTHTHKLVPFYYLACIINQVVGELWRPAGGAYNVDNVLKVMVRGLEQELSARMDGKLIHAMKGNYPSTPTIDAAFLKEASARVETSNADPSTEPPPRLQGADISIPVRRLAKWFQQRKQ